MSKIYVAVDSYSGHSFSGRLFTCKGEICFNNLAGMLLEMDRVYDRLAFPQDTFSKRNFSKDHIKGSRCGEEVVNPNMNNEQFAKEYGQNSTFIVHVKFRQNATWQGEIKWVDRGVSRHFRSEIELLKLMDDALNQTYNESEEIRWDEPDKEE